MAAKRRLSASAVPPSPSPNASSSSPDAILMDSSSLQPSSVSDTIHKTRLFERAEKLARMTTELTIHKLARQTNDLTRNLAALTHQTESNESFRQQNEERMGKMWREIVAVQVNLRNQHAMSAEERLDLKGYQREVIEVKSSMGEVRKLVEDLLGKVADLPTLAEANAVLAGVSAQREACEAAAVACERKIRAGIRTECLHKPIQTRIQETIKSTRRWHHDHKTTTLADAAFTANYLKKQSKRDPHMAVYIQRAIHRRIKPRRRESGSQPNSLEEFCKDVKWEDVTQTVEEVLVKKVESTVRSLSQGSQ